MGFFEPKPFALMTGCGVACGIMLWLALGIAAHGISIEAIDLMSLPGSIILGFVSGLIMYSM